MRCTFLRASIAARCWQALGLTIVALAKYAAVRQRGVKAKRFY